MAAFPVLQFCIFYIGVNIKSILFAFQSYDYDAGKYIFNGFENFKAMNSLKKIGAKNIINISLLLLEI